MNFLSTAWYSVICCDNVIDAWDKFLSIFIQVLHLLEEKLIKSVNKVGKKFMESIYRNKGVIPKTCS